MRILGFLLLGFLLSGIPVKAQEIYTTRKQKKAKETTIAFSDRWSLRTNTFDWLTTVPNLAVEFDVSDSVYNRWSLGVGLKFNYIPLNTDFTSRFTYKTADVRLEARRYFRAYQIFSNRSRTQKNSAWWRAYYVGPYLSYSKYAFQFLGPSFEGKALSLGITGGYNIPLYETPKGRAIDLDLGLSVGALYVDHVKQDDKTCTQISRILPYPMLTDLRIGLVYRWRSVRKKYVVQNEEKILRRHTERLLKEKLRLEKKYQDSIRQDSVLRAKESLRIKKQKKK